MSDTPPQKIWIDTEIYENRWHDHDVGESMDCFGPYHHDDTVQALVKAVVEFREAAHCVNGASSLDPSDLRRFDIADRFRESSVTLTAALAPFQQEGE